PSRAARRGALGHRVALVRAGRGAARRDLRPPWMGPPGPSLEDGHRPLDRPRGVVRPPVAHRRPSRERCARPFRFRHIWSPQLNAEPADQIRLLDVQDLDVRLQQLAHRRRSLPEHEEIESLNRDLTQLRDLLVAAQTEESDCAREQTKAEQDVDQVRQRAARDQKRLDSGAVSSPKDLENLQREIASLAKRQGDLEDVVLEVMERRESAQERIAELTERVASVQSRIDDVTARRDSALEEIDGEVASVTKEREVVRSEEH